MGKKMMKWFHLYADQGDAIKYTLTDKSRNEIASSVSEKKKNNSEDYRMVWIKK